MKFETRNPKIETNRKTRWPESERQVRSGFWRGRPGWALALVILLAFGSCEAAEIRVFAAASLTDSLKAIAGAYEKQSGERVVFNFGASSTLARQIEEGAPADIFFSADEAKMDELESKGLILNATRKNRLSNSLVVVVASQNGAAIKSPRDLAAGK